MIRLVFLLFLTLVGAVCHAAEPEVRFRRLLLSEEFHSEGAAAADIDGDGKMDVVSGPYWYQGPEFRRRQAYTAAPLRNIKGYSDHFFSWALDVDRDGRADIVTVGMPGQPAWWYRNPGPESLAEPWPRFKVLDDVGGESPALADMDGDERPELVCVHGGGLGIAFQADDPRAPWRFQSISGDQGLGRFTHGMGVGDVDGDGRMDLLETRGWWQQGKRIEDPFTFHEQRFAQSGGSQMYAYDFDGDGDNDVLSAQNAHGWGLTWFERRGSGKDVLFVPHPILTQNREDHPRGVAVSQLHSIALADLDRDGVLDIVTGKRFWAHGGADPGAHELPVLYWLRTRRDGGKVEFETRLLDERVGVGTQVTIADVTGDGREDVLIGNKLGTFVLAPGDEGQLPPAAADKLRDAAGTGLFRTHVRTTDPLSPEQEAASFVLPPGFEAQLFAAEPQIAKPMNLAFDRRGRLWVSSSVEYPLPAPEDREGKDTIKVLEDTDGDGRADKVTTFADNLNIPMGLYPIEDGVICFSIPDILLLRDTDGDGRADLRKRLYGPFDTSRDTHGMCNAFTRGYDGWLYACHGFNNQSTVAGADGHEVEMRSGNVFRMRLDGSRIEHVGHGQVNPFGLTFDRFGDVLTADCHTKPISLVLPGGWHQSFGAPHDGLGFVPNVMEHLHASTGIAGIALGRSLQFPAVYADSTFGGNVVTGRVNRNRLQRPGGSLRAIEEPDFLVSGDPWFRPVDLQAGPDGALYVADFYNRIIGHYEVKLDHPGRDRHRGRIWRIVYRGGDERRDPPPRDRSPADDWSAASAAECFDAMSNADPEQLRRLINVALDDHPDSAADTARRRTGGLPGEQIGALWVLARTGKLTAEAVEKALSSASPEVRSHALRALAESQVSSTPLIAQGLADRSAAVRRAAAIAAAAQLDESLIEPLFAALGQAAGDAHLGHSLRIALKAHLENEAWFQEAAAKAEHAEVLSGVCLALKTAAAGKYLTRRLLDAPPKDRSKLLEYATFAARYASDDATNQLAEAVQTQLEGELDQQLTLLNSIHDGLRQRGSKSAVVRDWGLRLARRLLAEADAAGDPLHWRYQPAGPAPHPQNCWVVSKRRNSADGQTNSTLFSSFPLGERRTGIYRSQGFTLGGRFNFYLAGHDGYPDKPLQGRNFVQLRLAKSHEVLRKASALRNDTAQEVSWDTSEWKGQSAYLELVDTDPAGAFAWLAAGRFSEPRLNPSNVAARRSQAAQLAGRLQLRELKPQLLAQLASRGSAPAAVRNAADALAELQPSASLRAVAAALSVPGLKPEIRAAAAAALGGEEADPLPVIQAAMAAANAARQREIADLLLADRDGLQLLLATIQAGRASATLLAGAKARERFEAVASEEQRNLGERLISQAPSVPEQIAQRIRERTQAYLAAPGRMDAGLGLFKKNFAVCHQVAGQGAKVGPNLDGIGNRGLNRLVEDMLAPNRNVDVAFRATNILTTDGESLSGALKSDDGAQVVLIDAKGKEIVVAKADIARRKKSTLSPMPENFAETIEEQQFRDLMAYLLSLRQ